MEKFCVTHIIIIIVENAMKIAVINCENAEKWKDYVSVISNAYGAEGNEDEFVEYQAFEKERAHYSRA